MLLVPRCPHEETATLTNLGDTHDATGGLQVAGHADAVKLRAKLKGLGRDGRDPIA
jgi:hypothetical protein